MAVLFLVNGGQGPHGVTGERLKYKSGKRESGNGEDFNRKDRIDHKAKTGIFKPRNIRCTRKKGGVLNRRKRRGGHHRDAEARSWGQEKAEF